MINGTRALRVLILSAGLLVIAFMLAACSSDDPTAAPAASSADTTSAAVVEKSKYGGIANFSARTDPPRGWDPMKSGSISILMIFMDVQKRGKSLKSEKIPLGN